MASRGRIDRLFRASSTSKIMKKSTNPPQESQVVDADLTRALKQIFEVRQLNGTQNTSSHSTSSSCRTEEPSLTLFGRKLGSPTSSDVESKNAQLPPAATAHLLKELHKQRLKQKGITATGNDFPEMGEIEFVHTERKPEVSTLPLLNSLQDKRAASEDWIQNGGEKKQRVERDLNLSLSIKLGLTDEKNATKDMEIEKSPVVKNPEQLTLFYNGQVLVYDDVPSDKAKAIMVLASSISSKTSCYTPSTLSTVKSSKPDLSTICVPPPKKAVIEKDKQRASNDNQARKASIQRFLEKRKDRFYSKAVTQTETEKPEGMPSKEGSPAPPSIAKPSRCGEETKEKSAMACEELDMTENAMPWIGV